MRQNPVDADGSVEIGPIDAETMIGQDRHPITARTEQ